MKSINIAINGFGRIGRLLTRILLNHPAVNISHINDLVSPEILTHLFRFDSAHKSYEGTVNYENQTLRIHDKTIHLTAESNPENLNWQAKGVDIVIECTGKFNDGSKARIHLSQGAKKVLLSAPGKGTIDATIVLGVNDDILTSDMQIISNASCTTNCLAPMVKVLDETFGIEKGYMNTVHAYTADQRLQDSPHSDLRRARAAAFNLVPTTTGAAKAVGIVLPHLAGKLDGIAVRVPIIDGSLIDFTAVLKQETTANHINEAMLRAAENSLKGILAYCQDPIVSSDIIGNPHSCIFDALSTSAMGNLVKVIGWYDNEWGYANRLADLTLKVSQLK